MRRALIVAVLLVWAALPGFGQARGYRGPGGVRMPPSPAWRPMAPGPGVGRSFVPGWRRPPAFHNFIRPLPFFDRRHDFLRRPGFRGPLWFPYVPYYGYYSYSPYYDPFFYSYDFSAYQNLYNSDMQLGNQIDNLRLQLQQLRDQNEQLNQQLNRPAESPPQQQVEPSAPPRASEARPPATVLVFRDGHRREVRNYAIVGQTLWILSESGAQKVPLGNLDLDQTVKANEDRGLAFPLPQSSRTPQ